MIKPGELLPHTREMALKNRGEIWRFNICIGMFLSNVVFENVFKPAIENKSTKKIIPILKAQYKELWDKEVLPKISKGEGSEKVASPLWAEIRENIAFITIDTGEDELKEADISERAE